MDTDIIEFQTFKCDLEQIHKFSPFNAEIREYTESTDTDISAEELNTIVVPARADGFEEVFIGKNCWYAIRIHASMIDKIKYIAVYQVAPVSAITHYAEVAAIEKWQDTNKYIVQFKDKAKEIKHINFDKERKGIAPQAPRYTSLDRLLKAKVLSDVF